jgi:hypothetical protein
MQLFDWLHAFGAQRVLVLPAQRLLSSDAAERAAAADTLYAFAGLAPLSGKLPSEPLVLDGEAELPPPPPPLPVSADAGSAELLMAAYRTYNRWLAALVGDNYPLAWGPLQSAESMFGVIDVWNGEYSASVTEEKQST